MTKSPQSGLPLSTRDVAIQAESLSHSYDHLSFTIRKGGIFGLLGESSNALSAAAKRRIGLVFEGHLAHEFMSIGEAEKFFSAWYPKWRRDVFRELVDRLGLPYTHRIRNMSEG